jgi:hypothetical protein
MFLKEFSPVTCEGLHYAGVDRAGGPSMHSLAVSLFGRIGRFARALVIAGIAVGNPRIRGDGRE